MATGGMHRHELSFPPWEKIEPLIGRYGRTAKLGDRKRCRRIATRYEKDSRNDLAMVHPGCALIWLD